MRGCGSAACSSAAGIEPVAGAPDGDDVARAGRVGLDLLPQATDVHRDRAPVAERAPDQLEQLVATEHLPRMLDEHAQQRELACRQLDLPALAADLVRCQVDLELPEAKRLMPAGRRGAPQDRLDAGEYPLPVWPT